MKYGAPFRTLFILEYFWSSSILRFFMSNSLLGVRHGQIGEIRREIHGNSIMYERLAAIRLPSKQRWISITLNTSDGMFLKRITTKTNNKTTSLRQFALQETLTKEYKNLKQQYSDQEECNKQIYALLKMR